MSPKTVEAIYPLSAQQQGMLFETLAAPRSGIHVEQLTCRLSGDLERAAFAHAWQELLARHAVLRTAFSWQNQARPLQVVVSDLALPAAEQDWRAVPEDEIDEHLHAFLDADRRQGFRLAQAPLMRLHLLRTGEKAWILVWTHHHILMDGWCRPLLLRELIVLYQARCQGTAPALAPSRPYWDYLAWLERQDRGAAEASWRQALAGFRGATPLGRPGAPVRAAAGAAAAANGHVTLAALTADETAGLLTHAQRLRVTPSTLVQAAWALLLSRCSGAHDVLFGVTVSGRPAEIPGIERAIGLFINTLPLRVAIDPAALATDWLAGVQAASLALRRCEHVAAGEVHRWSEVPAALPLYESIVVFENFPEDPGGIVAGVGLALRIDDGFGSGGQTRRPVTLLAVPGRELRFKLVHDPGRVEGGERLLAHLLALVRAMAEDGERPLAALLAQVPQAEVPIFHPLARAAAGDGATRAPRTAREELVALLWAQALGLPAVGMDDDFFNLGGHSLLASELAGLLREAFQVELPLRALFEHPTVAGLAGEIARLQGAADAHRDAVELLPTLSPDPAGRHLPFPLTDLQEAYWVGRGNAFELGNVATHLYLELEIAGLEVAAFEQAWRRLVDRHDMLRAVVRPDGLQEVLAAVPPYVVVRLDLRQESADAAAEQLAAVREALSHQVLPADRWPLFEIRASLLPGATVRLHLSFDLLIGDALSWHLLTREALLLLRDPQAALPPLGLTFRDYVLGATALERTPLYARSREYWLARLATLPPAPDLPLARRPEGLARPRFVRRQQRLDGAAWRRLEAAAARRGLTASVLLLAAFAEVLARWSRGPRFTLHLTLFNRLPLHPEVRRIVGDFTSLTLLAVDAEAGATFAERARRLLRQLCDDLDHRWMSGVRVLRELGRARGGDAQVNLPVVFTSTLGLTDAGEGTDTGGAEPLALREIYSVGQTSQVLLDHQVAEQEGSLAIVWDAVEELFPAGLLDAMFAAYLALLARLGTEEASWQEEAPVAVPPAHLAIAAAANDIGALVPTGAAGAAGLLHDGFLAQARRQPERPAVLAGERQLAYGELRRRAAALARRLLARGVAPGEPVAVVMSKGWQQVVAVLAILGAGGSYLPVEAELPAARRETLLRQGGVRLAVATETGAAALTWPAGIAVVAVPDEAPGEGPAPAEQAEAATADGAASLAAAASGTAAPAADWPDARGGPDGLAYTIFTSGSTGVPKGVMVDHRAALNTVADINRRFAVGAADRVLALSSLSFDLSVYDVFGLLAAGGALVLPEPAAARDPERWLALLGSCQVTIWNTVPALLEMLVELVEGRGGRLPPSLRLVLLSGDWIPLALPARLGRLAAGPLAVVSLGGATEAGIWSVAYPIAEVAPGWRSIPYGRPLANQTVHVLDRRLAPRPLWVAGDLYIGGKSLARGYRGDPAKTAASFGVPAPGGERLYRTGDLARWLPDGNLELLGREDLQVKIRGHRIELGEIEAALARHPDVAAAAVTAHGDPRGLRQLAAYVVPQAGGTTGPGRLGGPAAAGAISHLRLLLAAQAQRETAPAAGAVELAAPPLDEAAVQALYLSRRSFRELDAGPIEASALGHLLACLRPLRLAGHPLPKHRYGSAGSLYPVEVYLHVVAGRVRGLPGGSYAYHPASHRLVQVAIGAEIDLVVHAPINRPIAAGAAFSLFLIGRMDVAGAVYGERARHYATLEAGAIAHLLETSAAPQGIGLCQIGDLDVAALQRLLALGGEQVLLHSLVGGRIERRRTTLDAYREEAAAYQALLAMAGDGRERQGEGEGEGEGEVQRPGGAGMGQPAALTEGALRDWLRGLLPESMVPATFVFMNRLPLTANGKVNRKALPAPAASATPAPEAGGGPAPGNREEAAIAAIWRQVLHAESVGVEENFFTLGGHSVLMVRVYNQLRAALERDFPLVAMFEHPTIAALARYLRQEAGDTPAAERGDERGLRRRELGRARRGQRGTGPPPHAS